MRHLASSLVIATLFVGSSLSGVLVAQDDSSAPAAKPETTTREALKLRRAIRKMAELTSVSFTTAEHSLSRKSVPKGFGGMGGKTDKKSTGLLVGDLLQVRVDEDTILRQGRTTVVGSEEDWGVRNGVGFEGAPLPLVLDPQVMFRILAADKAKLARTNVGEWKQRPVQLISVELDRELCAALVYAGQIPDPSQRGGGFTRIMMGGKPGKPQAEGHAVFAVDPAFGHIVGMRFRIYHDPTKAVRGRVVVQQFAFQVGGAKAEVPKEIKELDTFAEGEVRWKDGLPQRALKKQEVRVDFEVNFAEHGKVEMPVLHAKAKALLGIK